MFSLFFRNKHSLSLTAAAASWGIATVISKRAVDEIPPLTMLPIQLAVSVAVLTAAFKLQRIKVIWSPELRHLGGLGVLNPGISYALSLIGLAHITASLSVLLWATEPVLILVLAWWLLGDRIAKPLRVISLLALGGVVLVVFESNSGGQLVGVALTLAGVAACAVYTVVSRKLIGDVSTLTVIMIQQSWALVFSVALLAVTVFFGQTLGQDASAAAWISAVVSGLLYYAVAFWFYISGLRHVPAAVAGVFINLIPVFGIAAGHVLLDERLSGRQWLGATVIVAAVATLFLAPAPGRKVQFE